MSTLHELCAVVASYRGDVGHAEDLSYAFDEAGIPRELARIFALETVRDGDSSGAGEGTAEMGEAVLVHIVKPRKKGEIRLVRKTREVAGKAIREAWNESPVQRDEEMNMPGGHRAELDGSTTPSTQVTIQHAQTSVIGALPPG